MVTASIEGQIRLRDALSLDFRTLSIQTGVCPCLPWRVDLELLTRLLLGCLWEPYPEPL